MMLRILIVGLVILVVGCPLLVVIGCGRYGLRAVRWCVIDTILTIKMVWMVVTVGLLMALILVMLVVLVAGSGCTSDRWYYRWYTTALMLRWQQIDVDIDVEIQVITGPSGYSTVTVLLTSIIIRIFAVVIRRVFITGIHIISSGRCVGLVAFVTFTGIGRVFITCRYTTTTGSKLGWEAI